MATKKTTTKKSATAKASKPAAKKAAAPKKAPAKKPAAKAVKKPADDGTTGDVHEKVQLWKDGPYWATTNIGAEKPEDFGYYFWWGDTVGYKREKDKWVATDGSSTDFSFEADNTPTWAAEDDCDDEDFLREEGWIGDDGVLVPEHDAAHIHWGGDWRMPTKEELENLAKKCVWTWKEVNGVEGCVVRGKGAYASASIFLPFAGRGGKTSLHSAGSGGTYWSSVPHSDSLSAWYLRFYGNWELIYPSTELGYRPFGGAVRPVQGFTKGKSIVKGVDGALCIESSSTPEIKVPINDPELIALIDEIRPKPKKVAKKKAQPKDYKGVTYMDVFKRVIGIMDNKTGYAPYTDGIEDEENGEVDIGLDFDGWEHIVWQNVRTFLGGWTEEDDDDYEKQSIFDLVADLDMKYEKLASRWDAKFCDSCRILGNVNVDDNSPAGIMEALDKAGL